MKKRSATGGGRFARSCKTPPSCGSVKQKGLLHNGAVDINFYDSQSVGEAPKDKRGIPEIPGHRDRAAGQTAHAQAGCGEKIPVAGLRRDAPHEANAKTGRTGGYNRAPDGCASDMPGWPADARSRGPPSQAVARRAGRSPSFSRSGQNRFL